jgi:hypothetical protein
MTLVYHLSRRAVGILSFLLLIQCSAQEKRNERKPGWYPVTAESKPWTRWWWQGSALTKEGITTELEAFQKAGIGGVEITPIYGVYGYEEKFTDYLSPQWIELLLHVLKEGERLGLGVDMATGTGWPFGGPWVSNDDACKTFRYKTYTVKKGERVKEKIEYIQEPFLRVVGNQRYEVHDAPPEAQRNLSGTRKEPVLVATQKKIRIEDLKDPINANKNLQALAIDQIQFEKPLKLKVLMGYAKGQKSLDLTRKVDRERKLDWTAPEGEWTLYAIFEAWHGKMVERAGPGGEGNVIDHFSTTALDRYLERFDSALKGHDIRPLRAFFNDSYEVDDARGSADFTPLLFDEFLRRRGYDLRDHLPAWLDTANTEYVQRIRADYRETISELVLENFTRRWKAWAHGHHAIVRNQAHGSPANILDLYAVVDIPEIEGNDPLRFRMASSSGNVTGKKLVSAEAATWHDEHFKSTLSGLKSTMDKFMLNGVNHLVYHGTAYSPQDEPWPGWLFYAAVHVNPRNPFWNDIDALNAYIARCQSFLQNSHADHDILVYYPIHDRLAAKSAEMIEHFDGIGRQFEGTSFAKVAETLLNRGFTFDFISDSQIKNLKTENGRIVTEGNAIYRTIVVPACKYMPLNTAKKLSSLAEEGNTIIYIEHFPSHTTGFTDYEKKEREHLALARKLKPVNESAKGRSGTITTIDELGTTLNAAGIERETIVDQGLKFIRKKNEEGQVIYFICNDSDQPVEQWFSLTKLADHAVIYDPMNASYGSARMKKSSARNQVFLQLLPQQTVMLESFHGIPQVDSYTYLDPINEATKIHGKWSVDFTSGGPVLPPSFETDSLVAWTTLKDAAYKTFSGTAVYTTTFNKPSPAAERWLLKFTHVEESAEVLINGKVIGTMIGPHYQLVFADSLLATKNTLQVKVSNSMANRIAWMDREGMTWKKFYNINFPARKPENVKNNLFDASRWNVVPSGLTGPVRLIPLKRE